MISMRHYIFSIMAASAALLALSACEKESAFGITEEMGMLNCESLNVGYANGTPTRATEANGVSISDFTVDIIKSGETTPYKSYLYSEMPAVVTLPVGTYKVQAHYGEEKDKEWNNPCYFGEISDVEIKAGEITSTPYKIECGLSNIKISVKVDDLGLGLVQDYNVTLRVGESDLIYDKSKAGQSAYFRYVEGSSSITAEFTGTVDGNETPAPIVITYNNAAPGNSYIVNFTVTKPDNGKPGGIGFGDTSLNVDSSIDVDDTTHTANPDQPNEDVKDDPDRKDNTSTQE